MRLRPFEVPRMGLKHNIFDQKKERQLKSCWPSLAKKNKFPHCIEII